MAFESNFSIKTDDDIVATIIDDTITNKIHWDSDDIYIFSKVYVNDEIYIIFRITDTPQEEEENYTTGYEYYEMNASEIVLTISMKKKTLKKEIFIKKVFASQMRLMYLLDHVMPKLKK